MAENSKQLHESQLEALAAVRGACQAMAPKVSAEGLNQIAQALATTIEAETKVVRERDRETPQGSVSGHQFKR